MKIDITKERLNFNASLSEKTPINEKEKTISFIALSKDNLHKRTSLFGDEYYLSVDTQGVDFKATNFYIDHNPSFDDVIGTIENVKLENGDYKAIVRFSDEIEKSKEAFLKYKNGFSKSVSVGILPDEVEQKQDIKGLPHYHITKSTVYELSAVWQGADPNAKVANFQKQTNTNNDDINAIIELAKEKNAYELGTKAIANNKSLDEFKAELMTNEQASQQKNIGLSKNEINEIIELGKIANEHKLALEAIQNGKSYIEFSQELLKKSQTTIKEQKIMYMPNINKGRSEKEFSLANILYKGAGKNIDLGFEYETSYNESTGRFVLPRDFGERFSFADQTTQVKNTPDAVATYYRDDLLIRDIKLSSPFLQNCKWIEHTGGFIEIPRDNSNVTADFVEESATRESEKLSFDKIRLSPHTISAKVRFSRTMLNMSAFSLEAYAYELMKDAIKDKLEKAILYGSNSIITGIFNTSGVLTVDNYLKTATTLANTLAFSDKLTEAGGNSAKAMFFFRGSDISLLRSTPRTSTSEKMLIEEIGNIQGFKYAQTELLKKGDCVYADFSKLIIANFSGFELLTHVKEGGDVILELFLDVDAKVAREKSFVISKTSTD